MKLGEGPRLRDYLDPQDLNTEGCVRLVSVILREAAEDYLHTRRFLRQNPGDRHAAEHMRHCEAFYKSDLFKVLSAGLVTGEAVMRQLDLMA